MSETILIKKKKLSIKEAVKLLKPFVEKWEKVDKETAKKIYQVYQECEFGIWKHVLDGLNIASSTWYYWVEKYNFETNFPQMEREQTVPVLEQIDTDNVETIVTDDEQIEILQYKETFGILKNAQRLSYNKFQNKYKEKLITELQSTIKKLTTLLLKVESNIKD